jgi:beta-mannanase
MYFGSVDGGFTQAQAQSSAPLANHAYANFTSKTPDTRMITVNAGGASWRSVANAGPGSSLYNDIVRWAQTIKSRPSTVMFAYNHEPEASAGGQHGSPADFIAAWRRVHAIFDQQHVTNVNWTWQMTAYAFRTSAGDSRYAAKWYPGDAYVDTVGADAYNWFNCGAGNGKWMELKALGDPVLAFARAHGKAAAFPEFASNANANRVQWIRNAHQYFLDNQNILTAAFYFNRPPTVKANGDCKWAMNTSAEYNAFQDIARDRTHFTN